MSEGGSRVSIEAMSPRALASVSVSTFGAGSPTLGMRSSARLTTWSSPGAA